VSALRRADRPTKVAVVFQGGGALGAFGAGAWSAIRPWLAAPGRELVALAGGSIGALNAALVAAAPDQPGDALETCWRQSIASVSLPFLGWPLGRSELAASLRSWNGLLTGLLAGNRGLYAVQPQNLGPWAEGARMRLAPYDPWPMRALLERHGLSLRTEPPQPLLAVAVTHIASGALRLLHSDAQEIRPEHVLASAAIPGMFPPRELDGEPYWDGDLVRTSPIPALIDALRSSGRLHDGEALCIVTVEQYAQPTARMPLSGREIAFRTVSLLQQGKLAEPLPAPAGVCRLRICRPPLPNDAISGEFDYSIERVEALIAQGRESALSVLLPADPAEMAITVAEEPA
jgi:NTE family protein